MRWCPAVTGGRVDCPVGFAGRRERSAAAPRVGLFGLLGSGNIGNDASMESVLRYLRADHPNAIVDAMCKGPATVTERYGIAAISLDWYQRYEQRAPGVMAVALKALGKGVDAVRTASLGPPARRGDRAGHGRP